MKEMGTENRLDRNKGENRQENPHLEPGNSHISNNNDGRTTLITWGRRIRRFRSGGLREDLCSDQEVWIPPVRMYVFLIACCLAM